MIAYILVSQFLFRALHSVAQEHGNHNYHNRCGESLQSFMSYAETSIPIGQEIDIDDPFNCHPSKVTFKLGQDLDEGGVSSATGSVAKERALGLVLTHVISIMQQVTYNCLTEVKSLSVWNTRTYGSVDKFLRKHKDYASSEILPKARFSSGTIVDGIRYENLEDPSFADSMFDIIISSDVMEHLQRPYVAHKKLFNALKPGGAHVFTTLFSPNSVNDKIMAFPNNTAPEGSTLQYSFNKFYPNGWIIHNKFGQEMLRHLCSIGYDVIVHRVKNRQRGVPQVAKILLTYCIFYQYFLQSHHLFIHLQMQLIFVAWKRKAIKSGGRRLLQGNSTNDGSIGEDTSLYSTQ